MCIIYILCYLVLVAGEAPKEGLKDEYCTDPRTMRKHAAYTEWADAYSCTRHRCQPGGRHLAIYTVGCKRVEAPESAIECEEVVEDTNMQFPYCCTRLRCLVVVRGEVWTRVLGQPWETLPAAPWSHMYKMKKPPPVDGGFLPKNAPAGPVYELTDENSHQDRRAGMDKECDKPILRASTLAPTPDVVIHLTTNNDKTEIQHKYLNRADDERDPSEIELEESPTITEKVPEIVSEEGMYSPDKKIGHIKAPMFATDPSSDEYNNNPNNKRKSTEFEPTTSSNTLSEEGFFVNADKKRPPAPWGPPAIPSKQWNENPSEPNVEPNRGDSEEKPASLQHLVNAIGTRMRDIETVVQQMSDNVQPGDQRRASRIPLPKGKDSETPPGNLKKPNYDNYNRFPPKQGASKYLRTAADATSEVPIFIGDRMSGYFNDPSNSLLRRSMNGNNPKEPNETYMAPINNEHKKPGQGEPEPKRRKHTHKKKKSKHGRRKHHREDREKKFSKILEDKNEVSLEESNELGKQ